MEETHIQSQILSSNSHKNRHKKRNDESSNRKQEYVRQGEQAILNSSRFKQLPDVSPIRKSLNRDGKITDELTVSI